MATQQPKPEMPVMPPAEMRRQTPEVAPATPPSPEQPQQEVAPNPESRPPSIEKEGSFLDETIEGLKAKLRKPKKQKKQQIPQVRDEVTVKVETIMEEGLKDAFMEMTPIQQQEFKLKGEETAAQIRQLLRATKVKVRSVFQLLVEWLRLLPGVNRFFIEQEAKIKADKIIALSKHPK